MYVREALSAGVSSLFQAGIGGEDEPAPLFKNPTTLSKELVDRVVEQEISGDIAFNRYFSSAESLNHIQGHKRGYVGI